MEEIDKRYFLMCNKANKQPKITQNDIAICCPICKEGNSWERKQRCHLYQKKNMDNPIVHCFNCDIHTNLYRFLEMVDENLLLQYKREKFGNKIKSLKSKEKNSESSEIIIKNNLKKDIPNAFLNLTRLPFNKNKKIEEYLKTRKLEKFKDLFYYSYDDITIKNKFLPIKDSIVIPLLYKNKLYGFQARKLDTKMFITYLPDDNSGFKIWNMFNVDYNKPVFLFESVFDALSSGLPLENIAAAMGSDIPQNFIDKLKYPIFCYDNHNVDNTANKKLLKLSEKYHCFIWPCEIKEKDFNELLQRKSFSEIKEMIKNNIEIGLKAQIKIKL